MSNYINQMLEKGWDFPAFAAHCANAMAIEHGRHEVSAFHDEEIAKGLERVQALLFLTDEQAHEKQTARLAELEARQREVWEQAICVDGMREQVEQWEPGENVDAQGLKRFMLEELDRGPSARLLEIHAAGIARLKEMTPREYLEGLYQHERQLIQSHHEAKETEAARASEWRAWREALATAGITVES